SRGRCAVGTEIIALVIDGTAGVGGAGRNRVRQNGVLEVYRATNICNIRSEDCACSAPGKGVGAGRAVPIGSLRSTGEQRAAKRAVRNARKPCVIQTASR